MLTSLIDDAIGRLASARYAAAMAKIEARDYEVDPIFRTSS